MFKKILFSLFFIFNVFRAEDELTLTFEEMEECIKHFPDYVVNEIHSKKGLEKLLQCVNNHDDCDHPALLNFKTDEKAKKLLESTKNESGYKRYDILFRDLYHEHEPVNLEEIVVNSAYYKTSLEIELRKLTKLLFQYLLGCLAYKRSFANK